MVKCLVNQIALYSPHTAFDAVQGGVNDWLIKPFGDGTVAPLEEIEPGVGPGRLLTLKEKLKLSQALERLKKHLALDKVRLALGSSQSDPDVGTIAVCAGSGGSVLVNAKQADLWITGEMSHHEVLDAVHHQTSVILCDHSNTERGFLNEYAQRLTRDLEDKVTVKVSTVDADPLKIV